MYPLSFVSLRRRRRQRWQILVLLCIATWSVPLRFSRAQDQSAPTPVPRYTLADCIAIALENQPAIAARQSALGAAGEQRNVARSYFLPQANFQMTYAHFNQPFTIDTPNPLTGQAADVFSDSAAFFGIARAAGSAAANAALNNPNLPPFSTAKQLALSQIPQQLQIGVLGQNPFVNQVLVTQPLFTGGKILNRYRQSDLGIQAACSDVVKSKQQTMFDVTQAYVGMQLTFELEQVVKDAAGQFAAIGRLVQGLLDEGDEYVTAVDLHRVRAILRLAESERVRIVQSRSIAQAALAQSMGIDPNAEFDVASHRLPRVEQHIELAWLIDDALRQRPELLKARLGVQNADLERNLAKAAYSPDLNAFGQFLSLDDGPGFLTNSNIPQWTVGVTLGIPLVTGGRRSAGVRKAEFEQCQLRQTEQLARNLITLEVKKVYLEYLEAETRLPTATEAVSEARSAIDGYRLQLLGNQITDENLPRYFQDLTTARLLLSQAQSEYHQIRFLKALSLAKICLVTGSAQGELCYIEDLSDDRH